MAMTRDEIVEYISESFEDYVDEILLADGFEEAFVGIVSSFGGKPKACYDYAKCVQVLAKEMTEEEAEEYMQFNVVGAYVGECTPAFLNCPDK
jgi:hypothetical protein